MYQLFIFGGLSIFMFSKKKNLFLFDPKRPMEKSQKKGRREIGGRETVERKCHKQEMNKNVNSAC